MWCVPGELSSEYVERMEEILDIYALPLTRSEPVVCLDEKPVQLHGEIREPIPARPGRIARRDSEYRRAGTANVFCAIEPGSGKYMMQVTKKRKSADYAKFLARLSRQYPRARTIHLIQDNLNTHVEKSLTGFYGEKKGRSIWNRFTVHYTPKHASWLNQAEIGIGVFSSQCLGKRRIPDFVLLRDSTRDWSKRANRRAKSIKWKFTSKDARKKFKYQRRRKSVLFTR